MHQVSRYARIARRMRGVQHAAATVAVFAGAWAGMFVGAQAQQAATPAGAPTTVEVRAGDTFSAIAARFTGDPRSWSKLYDAQLSGLPNPNLILVGMRLELVDGPSGGRYLRVVSERAATTSAKAAPATKGAAATGAPVAATPAAPVAAAAAPADDTLVIGVLPNIGAAALMAQYESLKSYLERTGKQKVRIVLPANFKAFLDATMRGEYDLAVAAPHFARVAQLDRGMVPLVMYEPRITALFLAPIDAAVGSGRDMRGKPVAFANPQSLVAMYGQQWLRQQSLEPGKDYEIKGASSDMGVGRLLLSGDAVAAIMSNGEFRALPTDESGRLKIVESFARIPNFIIVGHPRLGAARLALLKTQFKQFTADRDDGQAFLKATGLTGIVDADDVTLRELDPYVALTRRAMGYAN